MSDPTDDEITAAMITFGGSFVTRLGVLWRFADLENRAKLKATFSNYWKDYRELLEIQRKQETKR